MAKPTIDWGVARGLATSGIPLREIARQLGIPPGTVLSRAKRENWRIAQIFGPGGSDKIPLASRHNLNAAGAHTANVAVKSFHDKNSKSRLALASATLKASQHLENLDGKKILKHSKNLESVVRSASKVFNWSGQPQDNPGNAIKDDLFALSPQQLAALLHSLAPKMQISASKTLALRSSLSVWSKLLRLHSGGHRDPR